MTVVESSDLLSPELIGDAISWRHHLHQYPELAYEERRTSDFIAAQLGQFGLAVHRGLGGTGVVGTLTRGTSRRTIGIRADMDALRLQEKTGVPYASRIDGVMHACGHDGHVAMALAAARACAQRTDLDGTVHFIFQPAEEGGAGARRMIEDGLFRLFPCDSVYAIHNWLLLPQGTCAVRDGAMLAANAMLEIVIQGRGCHGAMPHQGGDVVLAGSQLISMLHSIVSRNVDPLQSAVISPTLIHAGETHNVIPDTCTIRGTARWYDDKVGEILERRINELSQAIAAGFDCKVSVRFDRRYPATINDPGAANFVRTVVKESQLNLEVVDAQPTLGAEDFSFMLQEVRGCYIWLGSGKAGNDWVFHSPQYDFNDEVLPLGAQLWVSLIRKSLARS
jgi:amidohydrolase